MTPKETDIRIGTQYTTCIYKSNFGLFGRLSRFDRFTNWLWYYVCEKDKLWAKIIYYPIHFFEGIYFRIIDSLTKKK